MTTPAAFFKATTPGGAPIAWDSDAGFTGEFADMLNADLAASPGHTYTPPAELARAVLLALVPGAKISEFVSQPLEPLPDGVMS